MPGEVVGGRFMVGRAMGQDADGIVYGVIDLNTERSMRIREYLPRGLAQRAEDGLTIEPVEGQEESYEEGLGRMIETAESPDDPERRFPYFEENNTAYFILRKRRTAAAEETGDEDEDEEFGLMALIKRRLPVVLTAAGTLVALVILAVVLVNRNAIDRTNDPLSPHESGWVAPTITPEGGEETGPPSDEVNPVDQKWQDESAEGGDADDWPSSRTPEPTYSDWDQHDWDNWTVYTSNPNNTPTPTIPPQIIKAGSDAALVTQVQKRLIDLAWLDKPIPDGIYDDATKAAVKEFQKCINKTQKPSKKLDEDGIVGPETTRWLNWAEAPRNPDAAPPTPSPTPAPTPAPEVIEALQHRLTDLGWLLPGNVTGVYDVHTANAVADFQRYVNEKNQGADLREDGVIDQATISWMDWSGARKPAATPTPENKTPAPAQPTPTPVEPTATPVKTPDPTQTSTPEKTPDPTPTQTPEDTPDPTQTPEDTPEPTSTPEDTPDPTSTPEEPTPTPRPNLTPERIMELQWRLADLGWLTVDEEESEITGVIDGPTTRAISAFQKNYNYLLDPEDETAIPLPTDGMLDYATLDAINSPGAPSNNAAG